MKAYTIKYSEKGRESGVTFTADSKKGALDDFYAWADNQNMAPAIISVGQMSAFEQSIFDAFKFGQASTIGD